MPTFLKTYTTSSLVLSPESCPADNYCSTWLRPTFLTEALEFLRTRPQAYIVAGATAAGIYSDLSPMKARLVINISSVKQLCSVQLEADAVRVVVGACLSLAELIAAVRAHASQSCAVTSKQGPFHEVVTNAIGRIAGTAVQNRATWVATWPSRRRAASPPARIVVGAPGRAQAQPERTELFLVGRRISALRDEPAMLEAFDTFRGDLAAAAAPGAARAEYRAGAMRAVDASAVLAAPGVRAFVDASHVHGSGDLAADTMYTDRDNPDCVFVLLVVGNADHPSSPLPKPALEGQPSSSRRSSSAGTPHRCSPLQPPRGPRRRTASAPAGTVGGG
jgi:CO/xanthine dehydrogenase FAD-binding subunit